MFSGRSAGNLQQWVVSVSVSVDVSVSVSKKGREHNSTHTHTDSLNSLMCTISLANDATP